MGRKEYKGVKDLKGTTLGVSALNSGATVKEDWVPQIPGITAPGSYDDYAKDPAAWIYLRGA